MRRLTFKIIPDAFAPFATTPFKNQHKNSASTIKKIFSI